MGNEQNCATFTGVIRANLHSLKGFSSERDYERGQTVYCVGDPAEELLLIKKGQVKIVRISGDGQQKILDIYQPGEFFGELCICGGHKRLEQAVALESLSVTSIKVSAILKLLRHKPEMLLDLLQLLCARLGESYDQIANLAFDNIPRRLAREILRLSRTPDARAHENGVHLGVSLSHEELAHLVGTSREVVTTVMKRFRERGLLDYSRRNIFIHPKQLEKFLQTPRR
ncbi:MAG: Crp/Fnr family transcriptional regulator [Terriglobia bacterium]